jgi:hypothetical protein
MQLRNFRLITGAFLLVAECSKLALGASTALASNSTKLAEQPNVGLFYKTKNQKLDKIIDVSIVAIIANPTAYAGKLVHLEGFFSRQFESSALYLSPSDVNAHITINSISFQLHDICHDTLSNSYVSVVGKIRPAKQAITVEKIGVNRLVTLTKEVGYGAVFTEVKSCTAIFPKGTIVTDSVSKPTAPSDSK